MALSLSLEKIKKKKKIQRHSLSCCERFLSLTFILCFLLLYHEIPIPFFLSFLFLYFLSLSSMMSSSKGLVVVVVSLCFSYCSGFVHMHCWESESGRENLYKKKKKRNFERERLKLLVLFCWKCRIPGSPFRRWG